MSELAALLLLKSIQLVTHDHCINLQHFYRTCVQAEFQFEPWPLKQRLLLSASVMVNHVQQPAEQLKNFWLEMSQMNSANSFLKLNSLQEMLFEVFEGLNV